MTPLRLLALREEAPRLLSTALANGGDFADLFAEWGTISNVTIRLHRGKRRVQHDAHVLSGFGLRVVRGRDSRFRCTDQVGEPETPESPGEMSALAEAAVDAALSLDPDLEGLEVRMQGRDRHVLVAPSDLQPALSHSTWTGIRVEAQNTRNGRRRAAHAIGGGPGSLDQYLLNGPEEIAKECIARLRTIADADTAVRGEMPVVIGGGWGGAWLHEAVGHLLEADMAASGPYAPERIGTQVATEGVTVIDGLPGSSVDHEGIASRPTTLIENGFLTALMSDRVRGRSLDMPLTGNGFRQDYRHEPLPRMTSLYMKAGSDSPGRLIEDVPSGLFVRMITHGRVHPSEDRFSFDVAEGHLIEQGRIGKAVTGLRVSGKASDVLLNVAGIADDLTFDRARGVCVKHGQRVITSVGMPTVLINKLTVEPIAT